MWRSVEECGGVWRSVEECGGVWRSVEECGGVWRSVEECGGVWRSVEECGGVWRNEEEQWRHSLTYVIIIYNDVTRACSNTIRRNLLTTHFLASLHVCDTIEGLILAYYDWLFDLTSVFIKSTSVL